ncbi:MAG: apolipoprotein N-acyltransferase [Parafilimonas sp.]
MQKQFSYNYKIAAIISALLTLVADIYTNFLPGFICYVPLFVALQSLTPKESFKAGFLFGIALSFPSYYWMVPGSERFTGNTILYGIIVFVICSFVASLYYGFINFCFGLLKIKKENRFSFVLNGLLISCLYVLGENFLMGSIATGMPWFGFHSGTAMLDNLYAIQPASYFGIHGISFIVVFINYLIASVIIQKKWFNLWMPGAIIIAYILCGFLILNNSRKNIETGKPFKLAILGENIPPEIRWNDTTGNMLVEKLLNLDREAAAIKPDIALWSESAIPWTYRPDDALVDTILKITSPAHITHILGMNTDYHENEVYNSVYCLLPDKSITGRYDKRFLLSLIEEPLTGMLIPFFSSKGFFVKRGESTEPLPTPYGKAGVMICNESSVSSAATDMVNNGAEFLVNLSNDGWFNNTYLVDLHFYSARLRAVETRKDIAMNSNNGYCGLIKASGEINMKEISTEPFVKTVTIAPNSYLTTATQLPLLFVFLCIAYILCFVMMRTFG